MHHFDCFRLSSIVKLACCILIRKIHIRWWFQFHQSSLLQAAAPLTKGLLAISFHGEMNMKLNSKRFLFIHDAKKAIVLAKIQLWEENT